MMDKEIARGIVETLKEMRLDDILEQNYKGKWGWLITLKNSRSFRSLNGVDDKNQVVEFIKKVKATTIEITDGNDIPVPLNMIAMLIPMPVKPK